MQDILVFPRKIIDGVDGFIARDEADKLLDLAAKTVKWMPREEAERSKTWVQPIPCAILKDPLGRYCVFRQVRQQRKDLTQRLSFVVGGHMDSCAYEDTFLESVYATLQREVREEVGITVGDAATPVGAVVDASSMMASRHVGLVYEVVVNADVKSLSYEEFSVRSKYDGRFLDISERSRFRGTFDPWSSIIFSQYMDGGFNTDLGRQPMLPMFDSN